MTPTRILVIDTDPAVRAVVRDVLTAAMLCEVVEAADAFTVNAELQRQQPDLVVVDAQLPDLSEVCWVVKQLRVVSGEIPVLAITLAEFAEVPDPVLAGVGVQRTLPKAFTADSLLAAVHDLLNLETPPPIDLTWPEVGDPADAGSLGRVGKPGKRVLVVEDDVTTLNLLTDILYFAGYDVITASDGQAGLVRAERDDPDLVILDHMMPGMHGIAVLQQLRRQGSRLPIIMLTAHGDAKMIRDEKLTWSGWKAGASLFIEKPFDGETLLHWVGELITTRTRW
ncbi:MAG: response regulator [Actinomycetia bacterium]|nr:response regulator [Actinomycetes bacterium]MCH9800354.1 response regulator [Actinomycetes bacterium]